MWCWDTSREGLEGHVIYSGTRGPEGNCPPFEVELDLSAFSEASVCSSQSGPDGGVGPLRSCAPDLTLPWDHGTPNAYGHGISLYDCNPMTGARNGEPIADCYGLVAYGDHDGCVMAVADGVSWGEPARRAARCAVLGVLQYLHASLCNLGAMQRKHKDEPAGCATSSSKRAGLVTSNMLFKEMIQGVHTGQALILQQMGTLTTLVLSLVVPHSTQCDKYKRMVGSTKGGSSWPWKSSGHGPRSWAVLSLTIGDSSAWVWRMASQRVDELTHAAHEGELRNARFTPGALGYATGEEPDLSNMTLSCTLIKPGDVVFLGSDGVGDNYDPCILKLARPAPYAWDLLQQREKEEPGQPPALTPAQMHEQSLQLLSQAVNQIAAEAAAVQQQAGGGGRATAAAAASQLDRHFALQAEARGGQGRGSGAATPQHPGTPLTPRSPHSPDSQQSEELTTALTAQALVDGMLDLTFKRTEALRVATMERARQAEQERAARQAMSSGGGVAPPEQGRHTPMGSLNTDEPRARPARIVMPPGKLDHATLCAFQAPLY